MTLLRHTLMQVILFVIDQSFADLQDLFGY
jgi:hypothetical protein